MPQYTTYYIKQGDTLPALAAMFLGDASLWHDLALMNRLRAPYISDRLLDQYEAALWEGILEQSLAAGALTLMQQSFDPMLALTGSLLYLEALTSNGMLVTDLCPIVSYQPSVAYYGPPATAATAARPLRPRLPGTMILETAPLVAYSAASYCAILPAASPNSFTVLAPGDALFIPVTSLPSGIVAAGTIGQFVDLFGIDIAIGIDDLLTAEGDLDTISNINCLKQGLQLLAESVPGDLPEHPEWGNELFSLIGGNVTGAVIGAGAGLTAQTLLKDPRVTSAQVTGVDLPAPDTMAIQANVQARGRADGIPLSLSVPGVQHGPPLIA